ncbi:MAG: DedA family protein [Negativicutes bacterium]|nr:DedA family protein [Negativicutes bacterium]
MSFATLEQTGSSDDLEQIIHILENYGAFGLFVVSFCEAIFSPVLPDIMLIPMALAAPELAIYYSLAATAGSVAGGFVGYAIGYRFGPPIVKKCVSPQYIDKIKGLVDAYGGWAIWIAAMAPIPYKFVSISAGAFRINKLVFLAASVFGRAKRFVVEGVLIYYYGSQALQLMQRYADETVVFLAAVAVLAAAGFTLRSFINRKKTKRCEE